MFQRDIFPQALITWKNICSANEWINGTNVNLQFCDLCPEGVQDFGNFLKIIKYNFFVEIKTNASNEANNSSTKTFSNNDPKTKSDTLPLLSDSFDLKQQTEKGWSNKIEKNEGLLEQDLVQGVEESEWTE